MSEHAGWDAEERVVDWDEMFGDVLPEQTGDDLVDRDPSSTGGPDDRAHPGAAGGSSAALRGLRTARDDIGTRRLTRPLRPGPGAPRCYAARRRVIPS